MKLLLLFFLVGCATAAVYDELAEGLFTGLMLEQAEMETFSMYSEKDVTTDVGNKLRELLDNIVKKIKEKIEKGEKIENELTDKLKEIKEKMKELKVDMGNKAKELMQKIRDRVKNILQDLLNKLDGKSERSVDEFDIVDQLAVAKVKEMFNKLKDYLRGKVDKEKLKDKVHEIFGKGNELADSLLEIIQKKGDEYKDKILDLIDRYLGKEETEKRSLKELWEKIKDYFKDLHIDLKEKYSKFGEWVKEKLELAKLKGKDKIDSIKNIAKEFIEHGKGVSKDVAAEALEFLRPYKEDLGGLWDQMKETVKDIMNRNKE